LTKAIEGFKQLSGKDDSLSQHAMYLLGDAYLKTGQKANARNAFLFCSSNSSNRNKKKYPLTSMPNFLMNWATRMKH
jgi:TolA-binding protein